MTVHRRWFHLLRRLARRQDSLWQRHLDELQPPYDRRTTAAQLARAKRHD